MQNVKLVGNVIQSSVALQGIFAKWMVHSNTSTFWIITSQIAGEHTICIGGMLMAALSAIPDLMKPLPVSKIKLFPLRLGGGANIYVLASAIKLD